METFAFVGIAVAGILAIIALMACFWLAGGKDIVLAHLSLKTIAKINRGYNRTRRTDTTSIH